MILDLKKTLNVFVISSFVSIITLTYLGRAYIRHDCPSKVPFESFLIFIPLLYGIFGIINYYVVKRFGYQYSFLVGILFGLKLSVIGRFWLNLPQLLFGFTKNTEYKVHIYAMILYACIFQFIITPLTFSNYFV
jgi:hypothetical protein